MHAGGVQSEKLFSSDCTTFAEIARALVPSRPQILVCFQSIQFHAEAMSHNFQSARPIHSSCSCRLLGFDQCRHVSDRPGKQQPSAFEKSATAFKQTKQKVNNSHFEIALCSSGQPLFLFFYFFRVLRSTKGRCISKWLALQGFTRGSDSALASLQHTSGALNNSSGSPLLTC